jgi:hypothetical protein
MHREQWCRQCIGVRAAAKPGDDRFTLDFHRDTVVPRSARTAQKADARAGEPTPKELVVLLCRPMPVAPGITEFDHP